MDGKRSSYRSLAVCYDRLMADMPYDRWMEWVRESWSRFGKPAAIVDLGCGTGTLTVRLAESGARIYGIDASSDMLVIANEKTFAESPRSTRGGEAHIQWLQQDMRELELPEEVDAAYSFCDSLNYLTGLADLRAVFEAVYRQLKPGGVLMFDMLSEHQFERYADDHPFVLDEPDLAYIWHCDYDHNSKTIEHDLTLFVSDDDGTTFRRLCEQHEQRAYEPQVVLKQLESAGFASVELTSDFTSDTPNADSERLFFTAVKSHVG